MKIERPTYCTDDHLEYLNTYGDTQKPLESMSDLHSEFDILFTCAREITHYWIKTKENEIR
jgi:hypothetical protein